MKAKRGIPWQRLFAQGAVIMTSILAALAVDAWWTGRLNAATERQHLAALQRDFVIAEQRASASLSGSQTVTEEVTDLFTAIREGRVVELGREAHRMMSKAVFYEVFSSPRGAYDAMVHAGEADLLQSRALKYDLADFYGGFEDTRVSEAQLLAVIHDFQSSDVFAQKISWAELGYSSLYPDAPMGPKVNAKLASWQDDPQLYNWLATIMVHQSAVAEDYTFHLDRVHKILAHLERELE